MNYYEKHVGDYIRDTVSLSMVEDGAYNRLMDQYYQTERPLPLDKSMLYRLARAGSGIERKAVEFVIQYFFQETSEGYVQKRIASEIAKYQDKQRKAKASANARWGSIKTDANGMRTHTEGNAHQTPHTNHQSPDLKPVVIHTEVMSPSEISEIDQTCADPQPEIKAGTAGSCCKTMIRQGIHGCNPHHPTLMALLQAGASEQEFAHAARSAVDKGKPSFAYVIGTVKRQREDAAKLILHQGRLPNAQELLEESNRAATAGWVPPEMREVEHAN